MKLDLHKNLTALVTVDGKTITNFTSSMVYGKHEGDNDLYIYIKDSRFQFYVSENEFKQLQRKRKMAKVLNR